ncbi:fibronectin type III domain-containing protein [bacterium]|nr:fibronectin type III domain-containing protein [bacterium]MCI0616132.1 fibronectin type III domain-containing protein [bacterium]
MGIMNRRFLFLMIVIIQGLIPSKVWADMDKGAQIPFADVDLFIEFNSTDEDVGVQVSLDGDPWRELTIVRPDGGTLLRVTASRSLRTQGLTEFFFESSEPSLDEVPLPEFLARFPEGEYRFFGKTIEGERIEGTDSFTHAIPDGPSIVSPERNGQTFDLGKAIISWDPVTTPAGIEIVSYEVIVSGEEREFTALLPPNVRRIRVPREILQPGMRYEFEVLAKEVSGNQTITSGFFRTSQ